MKENLELKAEVELLVDEVRKTHCYSMSKIYGVYNKLFDTNDTPEACASCLKRKLRQMELWLLSIEDTHPPAAPVGRKRAAKKKTK